MLLLTSQFESYSFKANVHCLSISFSSFLFPLHLYSPILVSFCNFQTLLLSSFQSFTFFYCLIPFVHFLFLLHLFVHSFIVPLITLSPSISFFLYFSPFLMSCLTKHRKIYTATQIPLRRRLHRYVNFPPCNAYTVVACFNFYKSAARKGNRQLVHTNLPLLAGNTNLLKHENNANTCSRKTTASALPYTKV